MKTITLRGIDEKLERLIKINSKEAKMSVNQWLLHTLKKVTGMENKVDLVEHKDLDELAGSWTKEELQQFSSNTSGFGDIDEELWK